ncbi:hypothetical protein QAD02_009251 [Eretmocerus hayati]|uniref:Uncharacterized protein n=1 Tax=Eretmocerus hayati TaxID=131215 RepID=A0ACC2N9H4_9HYME|nr:hypothetical protein QAD02_009251 [Eretmocerus hayati]
MGTASPSSSSPSKGNGTSDDSTSNKEPLVYNQSVDQHLAPPLSVRKTLFCSPSVEEILAKSNPRADNLSTVNNPSPDLQNGHSYTLEFHDGVETSSNYTRETSVSINHPILQALKDSILSEIKAEINLSEKRLKDKIDAKFKELKNLLLRDRNLCVSSVLSWDDFKKKHSKFTFPINNLGSFSSFNSDLSSNSDDIQSDLKKYIQSTTAPVVDVRDNLDTIISNVMSKKLLKCHCAQNSVNNKPTIKDTQFFKVVRDSLCGLYNTPNTPEEKKIDEDILCRCVGLIINAKRSSGGGNNRKNLPSDPNEVQDHSQM